MEKGLNEEKLQNYLDRVFFETLDECVSPFLLDTRCELIKRWKHDGRDRCAALLQDKPTLTHEDNAMIAKYIQEYVRDANPFQYNNISSLKEINKDPKKLDIVPASTTMPVEKNIFSDLNHLYTAAYLNRVKEIVDEASGTDMRIVHATGVYELVHRINYKMMGLKSDGYRRFNYQVWYDQKEGCIRLQLFDPYGTLQDNDEYRISVGVDEPDEIFSDIPEDGDADDDTQISYTRVTRDETMYRRKLILSVFKLMEENGVAEMGISVPHLFLGNDNSAKNAIRNMARIGLLKHRRDGKNPLKTYYSLSDAGKAEIDKSGMIHIPWKTWFHNAFGSYDNRFQTLVCNLFLHSNIVRGIEYFNSVRKLLVQLQRYGIVEIESQKIKLTDLGNTISKFYKAEMENPANEN